jgi:hypothetical protein
LGDYSPVYYFTMSMQIEHKRNYQWWYWIDKKGRRNKALLPINEFALQHYQSKGYSLVCPWQEEKPPSYTDKMMEALKDKKLTTKEIASAIGATVGSTRTILNKKKHLFYRDSETKKWALAEDRDKTS